MIALTYHALLASALVACGGDTSSKEPALSAAPVEEPAEAPPVQAPWDDRITREMPVNENWMEGVMTGGYTISDPGGRTHTAPRPGDIDPQPYPTAPDKGHVLIEFETGEGATIVVDYELHWNADETRFNIAGKEVQAVDGEAYHRYEKEGDIFVRRE